MRDKTVKLLFVDDDPVTCSVIRRSFENCKDPLRFDCHVFQSAARCLQEFESRGADLVLTDLRMPEMSGFELLSKIRAVDADIPVLVMTGYSSVENAVEAMKRGATDFLKKPFDFEELLLLIKRNLESARLRDENQLLKKRVRSQRGHFGMIGKSKAMKAVFQQLEKLTEVNCNVIITGESGTGKELVARALHDYSPRREAPFVVIDCGALTESLLESELFGHEKGAFTGALQRKRGLMEQASGGTLFLDEISNISDAMQMKLMRAIESQSITRVGGTEVIPIELRIISASNRDLEQLVREGKFRHDFYHRLNVVTIHLPSLAERRDDIPLLIDAFVREFSRQYQREISGFDPESLKYLLDKNWTGNVRELRNTVERCVILADSEQLTIHDLAAPATASAAAGSGFGPGNWQAGDELPSLDQLEEQYINYVLEISDGKKTLAADILGIDKTTLWRKLRKYQNKS